MTRSILFLFVATIALFGQCRSQTPRGEFANNSNGLMYSEADMTSLRFIVDSLNLRFKTCDLSKTFYSNSQAKVYTIYFKSPDNDLKEIIRFLKSNPGFNELATKYPTLMESMDTSGIIIRNSDEKVEYRYLAGSPHDGYTYTSDPYQNSTSHGNNIGNSWSYNYSEKDKYSKNYSLTCNYYPEDWKSYSIPPEYGRLIQYVDCMIDTNAVVFLTDKYTGGRIRPNKEDEYSNLEKLIVFLNADMKKKTDRKAKQLSEEQMDYSKSCLKNNNEFRELVSSTIDEYVKNKTQHHQLEELAAELELFEKVLLMKRSYRVMGFCSQDDSPRLHARDIAIYSARSHSWDIFLRAHLDIMNDRFERASDGSYAWEKRETYLRELEELNLNIVDLIFGLTLRAENVANNHYYGTIWRMGKALTESKDKKLFEQKAVAIMKDPALDEFNRGLVFLLYRTYLDRLEAKEGNQKRDELRTTVNSFPGFIQASILQLKDAEDEE